MAEWFKALVLKTSVFKNTKGSNPFLSLKLINLKNINSLISHNILFVYLNIKNSIYFS